MNDQWNESIYTEPEIKTGRRSLPPEKLYAFLGGFLCCAVLSLALWFVMSRYVGKEAEIRRTIAKYYLNEISSEAVTEGKYRGMVEATGDPYSQYFTRDEYKEMTKTNRGVYTGIGIVFSTDPDTKDVTIADIYEGSPAERAGLLPGDSVVDIDGVTAHELNITEMASRLRSGELKSVTITVTREGETEPVTVTLKPEEVDLKTVSYVLQEDKTGYIAISNFRETTAQHFESAMKDLEEQGMERLVIDLRGNGGGLVSATTQMLGLFMPEGLLVYTVDKDGTKKEYRSFCEDPIDIPLAVLVDQNSASASEIFAGAVKDRGAGIVVGVQTFGKGIVQTYLTLHDNSAVKLTTANYYTPNGTNLNGTGITPDIEVEMPEDGIMDTGKSDAQYQAALRALKE